MKVEMIECRLPIGAPVPFCSPAEVRVRAISLAAVLNVIDVHFEPVHRICAFGKRKKGSHTRRDRGGGVPEFSDSRGSN